MNNASVGVLLEDVNTIIELSRKVRDTAGEPALESFMRFTEMYAKWAAWFLGDGERWPYEVERNGIDANER